MKLKKDDGAFATFESYGSEIITRWCSGYGNWLDLVDSETSFTSEFMDFRYICAQERILDKEFHKLVESDYDKDDLIKCVT